MDCENIPFCKYKVSETKMTDRFESTTDTFTEFKIEKLNLMPQKNPMITNFATTLSASKVLSLVKKIIENTSFTIDENTIIVEPIIIKPDKPKLSMNFKINSLGLADSTCSIVVRVYLHNLSKDTSSEKVLVEFLRLRGCVMFFNEVYSLVLDNLSRNYKDRILEGK